MTIRYSFSNLIRLISNAEIPAFIAENVFANAKKFVEAMATDQVYTIKSPTGETIEIRMDTDA